LDRRSHFSQDSLLRSECERLVLHAESAKARQFYLHVVPEFETGPTDDRHLVLLMKDIRRTLLG